MLPGRTRLGKESRRCGASRRAHCSRNGPARHSVGAAAARSAVHVDSEGPAAGRGCPRKPLPASRADAPAGKGPGGCAVSRAGEGGRGQNRRKCRLRGRRAGEAADRPPSCAGCPGRTCARLLRRRRAEQLAPASSMPAAAGGSRAPSRRRRGPGAPCSPRRAVRAGRRRVAPAPGRIGGFARAAPAPLGARAASSGWRWASTASGSSTCGWPRRPRHSAIPQARLRPHARLWGAQGRRAGGARSSLGRAPHRRSPQPLGKKRWGKGRGPTVAAAIGAASSPKRPPKPPSTCEAQVSALPPPPSRPPPGAKNRFKSR